MENAQYCCTGKMIRMILLPVILSTVLLFSQIAFAQNRLSYQKEKAKLVHTLGASSSGDPFTRNINAFYNATCDSLIRKKVKIGAIPVKIILTRLFTICNEKLRSGELKALRIPSLNQNFLLTLNAYKDETIFDLFRSINITQSRILQSVFDGQELGYRIQSFVELHDMINDPFLISSKIEQPQYEVFKDSLLFVLANGAPEILITKLAEKDPIYTKMVNGCKRNSVKAVSRLCLDSQFDRMMPFGMALQENRITEEEVKALSMVPAEYYHAFAREVIRLHNSTEVEENGYLKNPLVDLNKKFANHYFIKTINDLHESPGQVRFKVLEPLSPLELYLILVADNGELVMGGSSALYTSSFLYVFKEFVRKVQAESVDGFLNRIGYYQFNQFLSNISDYGMIEEFVTEIEEKKMAELLLTFLSRFRDKMFSDNEIILQAMTAAQILYDVNDFPEIKRTVMDGIDSILHEPGLKNYFMYQKIYAGLRDVLLDKDGFDRDQGYDKLQIDRLRRKGVIVQASFFYDDEDGNESFNSNVALYDEKVWKKQDMGNFIIFSSVTGNPVKLYMNKPNTEIGYDSAQHEMLLEIQQKGYEITSYVHRGHSYYLLQSIQKMTSSCEMVFLGSCGGYSQVLKIFNLNPNVNIISTRGVGSKFINDPLLEKITSHIVNAQDIDWEILWGKFDNDLQSEYEKDLFSSYIPPHKYIGIKFIRKVFEY